MLPRARSAGEAVTGKVTNVPNIRMTGRIE
jgi:hypothetical protein